MDSFTKIYYTLIYKSTSSSNRKYVHVYIHFKNNIDKTNCDR